MFTPNPKMKQLVKEATERNVKVVAQRLESEFSIADRAAKEAYPNFHDVPPVQLAEHFFVNLFLPFFAKDKERAYPEVELKHWMGAVTSVGGDFFTPVEIIDTSGRVVVTVPPLYNHNAQRALISQEDKGNQSAADIVAGIQNYQNMGRDYQHQLLVERMAPKIKLMQVKGAILANARAWNTIFAHYGRPLIGDSSLLGGSSSSPNAQDPDVADEYELS